MPASQGKCAQAAGHFSVPVLQAPAWTPDTYLGYLHNLAWLNELLSQLDSAIAAGGSPWHMAGLRASRDLLMVVIARIRVAVRAPLCLVELDHERAKTCARGGWLDIECYAEEQPDGSYQVLSAHGRIVWDGDALAAKGELAGALTHYQAGRDIVLRGLASNDANAGWQRELSVCENKIGEVLAAQGDLVGAMKSYQASLQIVQKLAAANPSNAVLQSDLVVSYFKLGALNTPSNPTADRIRLLSSALQSLDRLQQAGHLTAQQKAWAGMITQALQQLGALKSPEESR
jgi:hypothetical protein